MPTVRRWRGPVLGIPLLLGGVGLGLLAVIRSSQAAQSGRKTVLPSVDNWLPARLTEYFPNLPADAPASLRRQEGGSFARSAEFPVITLDQHRSDRVRFPFATVAADTNWNGRTIKKGYGPRVYFAAYPNDIFRIYDTGGNFRGEQKKIREGAEPFDIALDYAGKLEGKITTRTSYFIDWEDILVFPTRLRRIHNS